MLKAKKKGFKKIPTTKNREKNCEKLSGKFLSTPKKRGKMEEKKIGRHREINRRKK